MDIKTAAALCKLNNDFYRNNSATFAATRSRPWPGWERCLAAIRGLLPASGGKPLSILDLACGNLRFENYLSTSLPDTPLAFYAVDNCDALLRQAPGLLASAGAAATRTLELQRLDVMEALFAGAEDGRGAGLSGDGSLSGDRSLSGAGGCECQPLRTDGCGLTRAPGVIENAGGYGQKPRGADDGGLPYVADAAERLAERIDAPPCDLAAAFGFLHHVPLQGQRIAIILALLEKTRPGGLVAATFWRYLEDEHLAAKARRSHVLASGDPALAALKLGESSLGEGDLLLGWQDTQHSYRYCHSFSDAEIDAIAAAVSTKADVAERFTADGKGNKLNTYLLLKKRGKQLEDQAPAPAR